MSDQENPVQQNDRTRVVEPKFFHAEVGGKRLLVVAKTRRGAANGLARRLAAEIEKSLSPASPMEVFRAGGNGTEVVDVTSDEPLVDDDPAVASDAG